MSCPWQTSLVGRSSLPAALVTSILAVAGFVSAATVTTQDSEDGPAVGNVQANNVQADNVQADNVQANNVQADNVQAELGQASAWVGEPITMSVTLFSPGPFDGTATFQLPELSRTAIVKVGNPLVGSQTLDGESFFTQRHEFMIFTQRSGEIVIPSFAVRFAGKETFTSDPEPMKGTTPELKFESKRPPGTELMGLVVSASDMSISQSWKPEPRGEIDAGDVIERSITRSADDTTAMLFPPIAADSPDGVRVYVSEPLVEDKVDRGDVRAQRIDTLKYQFQRAGTFSIPDIEFVWWDPSAERLERKMVDGLTLSVASVAGTVSDTEKPVTRTSTSTNWILALVGMIVICGGLLLVARPASRWIAACRYQLNRSESIARRELRSACLENQASAAHSALLAWVAAQRGSGAPDAFVTFLQRDEQRDFRSAWESLTSLLFAAQSDASAWDGAHLWSTFVAAEKRFRRFRQQAASHRLTLPELNPTR